MVDCAAVTSEVAAAKRAHAATLLAAAGLDGWLLISPDGRDPAVPLVIPGTPVCQKGHFLIARGGAGYAAVSTVDALELAGTDGLLLSSYVCDDGQAVVGLLRHLGGGPKRIAVNRHPHDHAWAGLSAGRLDWLVQVCDEAGVRVEFVSARATLAPVRAVKTSEELRRLGRAADLAAQIADDALQHVKVGQSERDIHRWFIDAVRSHGVTPSGDGIIVGLGGSGYTTHHEPTERAARPGDQLMVDFGVVFEGYASDISRTFYFPLPGESRLPQPLRALRDTHRGAIDAALPLLRPGVMGWEVDAAARAVVRAAGLPEFEHALGHQIGRLAHDGGTLLAPRWPRYGEMPDGRLQAGEVYTLEPTIITPDGRVCQIEEEVLVTADGPVLLTRRPDVAFVVQS